MPNDMYISYTTNMLVEKQIQRSIEQRNKYRVEKSKRELKVGLDLTYQGYQ